MTAGEVEAALRQAFRNQHQGDASDTDAVSFHSVVPTRNRQRMLRRFTTLSFRGKPLMVAKVSLDPDDGKVVAEHAILLKLGRGHFSATEALSRVPRGFVMRYVPGMDFADQFRMQADGADRARLVDIVVDEIVRFHTATKDARQITPAAQVACSYLGRSVPLDEAVEEGLRRAVVGPAHGDLGPWNIRVDSGSATLIDWEDYRREGLPALDILNLAVTLALLVEQERSARTYEELFLQTFGTDSEFRALASRAIRRWAERTGASARWTMALVPLFCYAMVRRIEAEGRDTAHMFFQPFARCFTQKPPVWVQGLDD